jgi:hypothetical protein
MLLAELASILMYFLSLIVLRLVPNCLPGITSLASKEDYFTKEPTIEFF